MNLDDHRPQVADSGSKVGILRRILTRTPPVVSAFLIVSVLVAFGLARTKWSFLEFGLVNQMTRFLTKWSFPESGIIGPITRLLMLGAIFTAGALQRLNWRHALLMLAILVLEEGLSFLINWTGLVASQGYHPYYWPITMTIFFGLLGAGEALTTGRRDLRTFAWLLLAAIAAACVLQTISEVIIWSGAGFSIKTLSGGTSYYGLGSILYRPMVAILAWTFIPAALAVRKQTWRYQTAIGGLFASVMVLYVAFFGYFAFTLAEPSVEGRGPFTRNMGVLLLEQRGRQKDFGRVIRALLAADWESDYPHYYFPSCRADWRRDAIKVLARNKSAAKKAADALANLLRKKRTHALAAYSAALLAEEKKLDVVPILFRYSAEVTFDSASEESFKALAKMGIPEIKFLQIRPIVTVKASDEKHPHLPPMIQKELDRELKCYTEYINAFYRWRKTRDTLLHNYFAGEVSSTPGLTLRKKVQVAPPDFDAPTVDLFEKEVRAYAGRVDDVIRKLLPSPTTSPGSDHSASWTAPTE